ncbi:hypothetical protein VMCG_09715 [Cytospora schulzeri]|uniref:Uncharacterized protein n=1 Tax=Cytospora schulzeri TaxID=448051 RepID=A0A423VHH4_9PEZI|nr:hypothetical protein VMCG_09715 [Valsa malicola]
MFGNGFLRLGGAPAFPTFIGRLRSWFRQSFALDFQVSEILGPVPVTVAPKAAPLISTPPVFTRTPCRGGPRNLAKAKASGSEAIEMGPIIALRRLRRRQGWYDTRRRSQTSQGKEERTGLLAAEA